MGEQHGCQHRAELWTHAGLWRRGGRGERSGGRSIFSGAMPRVLGARPRARHPLCAWTVWRECLDSDGRRCTCSTATRPSASESRSMKMVRAVLARSSSAERSPSSSMTQASGARPTILVNPFTQKLPQKSVSGRIALSSSQCDVLKKTPGGEHTTSPRPLSGWSEPSRLEPSDARAS